METDVKALAASRLYQEQIVAIRPPEYWPMPIAIALMDRADLFVLADTLQYSRQSYQNRARLRTPQGWQWISVPLKGGQHGRPICDVRIRNSQPWRGHHWRALHYNYRRSPYFELYEPRLRPLFEARWETLGSLTCCTMEQLAEFLGISTPVVRASQMPRRPSSVPEILEDRRTRRLLTGANTYDVDRDFADEVHILQLDPLRYRQNFAGFVSGLSILDLLFNYGPETLSMIRQAVSVESLSETVGQGG